MQDKLSRRTVIAGVASLPLIGISTALARQQGGDSTPASSPMASPGASPAASPMASPEAGGEEITVLAEDIKFDKTELTIPANTDVKITLENKGVLEHDFVIDELDILIGPIKGGETAEGTINAEKGEYDYYCSIPGHREAGMEGKLTVE